MTEDDVLKLLQRACDNAGSQALWAKSAGVSQQYVNDVLAKRRAPGKSILSALNLGKSLVYARLPAEQRRM